MVSKVIFSCVVLGFVLISCNGRHTTSQDRSLLEAGDTEGKSFHRLNTHGMSHDMLRENTDSTFWITSGTNRDETRPLRNDYRKQPEDESSRNYGRTGNTRRSGYSDRDDERTNGKLISSDFKTTLEASDEQTYGPMKANMRNNQHMNRHHHEHHYGDSDEYSMNMGPKSQMRQMESSRGTRYQPSRGINLVTSQEQSRESLEGLQVQKVSHNTSPQQAGNARRKSNYMQSRGQESRDNVNSSQEDVANKIYKKNN